MLRSLLLVVLLARAAVHGYDAEVLSASLTPVIISHAVLEPLASDSLRVFTLTAHTTSSLSASASYRLLFSAAGSASTCADSALVVVSEHAIACQGGVPNGAGVLRVVLERLTADGQVEARHQVDAHYPAPVVVGISGGDDGVPLVVSGSNFGPRDAALASGVAAHKVEVFVGPFPAHSAESPCAVVDDAGTQIRCGALPIGFGTGLRVTVCVGGVCGTSEMALHDFAEPVIEKSFRVGQRLHLVGKGFGPSIDAEAEHLLHDTSSPALHLEIGGRVCTNPEMIVPDREIACDADEHIVSTATDVVLARRSLRATMLVKRSTGASVSITGHSPKGGSTAGDFPFTVYGENFGVVGQSIVVLVGGRQATNCQVKTVGGASGDVATCDRAPVGAGPNQEVTVSGQDPADAVGCSPNACAFSYDAPSVATVSRPSTRGGSIDVRGRNFGPSFVEKKVWLRVGGVETECPVTRGSHDRIQCDAPAGAGENLVVTVEVGGQRSRPVRELHYRRPDIVSTTRPHWRGGHIYIRGYNFGTDSSAVSVYIGDSECRDVKITQPHRVLRCYAPSGSADGKHHDLKVRVNGQSSASGPEGYASDRLQYTNTPPEFEGNSHHYVAVAGQTLKIRLPTRDADGDDVYYRAQGLPEGASWRQGDGFMQIEYAPPSHMLQHPQTELDMTVEVSASDGPDVTKLLIDLQARACPVNQDVCKDQSCADRGTMCPRCPLSNVVRCPASRPLLDPTSGSCYSGSDVNQSNTTVGSVAQAGYTFSVDQSARLSLVDGGLNEVGALIAYDKALVAAPGPQPSGSYLSCVEVAPCAEVPRAPQSVSVQVKAAGSYAVNGLYLTLPTYQPSDGYGLCLGVWDASSSSWQCSDESLGLHGGLWGGRVTKDGCYALMSDNCPDHANPDQSDADGDGEGDSCQGGASGCRDCNTYEDIVNFKYLQRVQIAPVQNEQDDCAKYQDPVVITTEPGDRFDARTHRD